MSSRASAGRRGAWRRLGAAVVSSLPCLVLHAAYVRSPGHYANLADPVFSRSGQAVLYAPTPDLVVRVVCPGRAANSVAFHTASFLG